MSTTLQIQNGHIVINAPNGQLVTVGGNRKAAQDLAETILQDYLLDNDTGSYVNQVLKNNGQDANTSELLVRCYLADGVNRLIARQMEDPAITPDEQIEEIEQLQTIQDPNSGTLGFYVNCSTADGGQSVEVAALQPTLLNQLTEGF
jgi:hypothetical protein